MQEMENIERLHAAIASGESSGPTQSDSAGTRAMRPSYRSLSESEAKDLDELKVLGAQLWDKFDSLGPGRETALAKTNLEQAIMWAVKHITR